MSEPESAPLTAFHSHVFLGEGHEKSERRTWAVIWLCAAMMALVKPARSPSLPVPKVKRGSLA